MSEQLDGDVDFWFSCVDSDSRDGLTVVLPLIVL